MLVLTRKQGETVQVGDEVCIKVLRTQKGRVRLGLEAPPDVPIFRPERNRRPRRLVIEYPAEPRHCEALTSG